MTPAEAATTGQHDATPPSQVHVLQVPDCPLVERLLAHVRDVATGADIQITVKVSVGDYPSPTLVVGGMDVATGRPVTATTCCRLDLPTRQQILDALRSPRT